MWINFLPLSYIRTGIFQVMRCFDYKLNYISVLYAYVYTLLKYDYNRLFYMHMRRLFSPIYELFFIPLRWQIAYVAYGTPHEKRLQ